LIQDVEKSEFPFIGTFFRNGIGHLNKILLAVFLSKKINFTVVFCKYRNLLKILQEVKQTFHLK